MNFVAKSFGVGPNDEDAKIPSRLYMMSDELGRGMVLVVSCVFA